MTDTRPETPLPDELLPTLKAAARVLDELPNEVVLYNGAVLDVAGLAALLGSTIVVFEKSDQLALLAEARQHIELAATAMARGNLRDWRKHQDRAQAIVNAVTEETAF